MAKLYNPGKLKYILWPLRSQQLLPFIGRIEDIFLHEDIDNMVGHVDADLIFLAVSLENLNDLPW